MSSRRFGKHPVKHDYRTLRFKNYLSAKLGPPPDKVDTLARVYKALGVSDASALFPMDGNDVLGDCTIAALAHAVTVNRALASDTKHIMPKPSVEKLYFRLSGGIDSGLAELDVLNYWRKHQVSGDKILGFVSIDPKNHDHIKQAIHIFGGVYLGFQCQQNCDAEFAAKQPWKPGKLTNDGHAVYAVGYDKNELNVLTWGSTQRGTWAWWNECVDEAYAILPPEGKDSDFAGVSYAELKTDLAALTD